MEKGKNREPSKLENKLARIRIATLGLLAIVFALTSCQSINSTTTDSISSPTSTVTIYPYSRQFPTLQLAYTSDSSERVSLGFNDMSITFIGDTVTSSLSPPPYLSERPCESDPLFIKLAGERSQPLSIEDLRETVCNKIEIVARQIEMPEEQIPGFIDMVAKQTVVIKNEDIKEVCGKDTGACYERGNIILSLNNIQSLPHEVVHFFEDKIPDGKLYLPNNNVCMMKRNGIISFVYINNLTNWHYFLSNELFSVLNDIQTSPMGTSRYTPDPNAQVTIELNNIAQSIDNILKMLIPHGTLQPTLADIAKILNLIIEKNGIQELISANDLLFLSRVGEQSSNLPFHLSPAEACQGQ